MEVEPEDEDDAGAQPMQRLTPSALAAGIETPPIAATRTKRTTNRLRLPRFGSDAIGAMRSIFPNMLLLFQAGSHAGFVDGARLASAALQTLSGLSPAFRAAW
jgi:hypothetical protein